MLALAASVREPPVVRRAWALLLAPVLAGCTMAAAGGSPLPLDSQCTPVHLGGHHNKMVTRFTNRTGHTISLISYQLRITNSNGETIDELNAPLAHPRVLAPGHTRIVHRYDKLLGTPTSCLVIQETTGT